jgi:hypothetical protein
MADTTGFQFVFDFAQEMSLNRRHVVAQSTTRSGVVRSVSRGAQPKKFTVTLPNGMPWQEVSANVVLLDTSDRFTIGSVTINDPGHAWIGNTAQGGFYGNTYSLICTSMPQWTLTGSKQVNWSGPFEFTEYVA